MLHILDEKSKQNERTGDPDAFVVKKYYDGKSIQPLSTNTDVLNIAHGQGTPLNNSKRRLSGLKSNVYTPNGNSHLGQSMGKSSGKIAVSKQLLKSKVMQLFKVFYSVLLWCCMYLFSYL